MHFLHRRHFLLSSAFAACNLPVFAQSSVDQQRKEFSPVSGQPRTFDVTTSVNILKKTGATKVWLPVPSLNTSWQKTLANSHSSNGITRIHRDVFEGTLMLFSEFDATVDKPFVEITSRVVTQNRSSEQSDAFKPEHPNALKHYTRSTPLIPTDGIVKTTAAEITQSAPTDLEKVRAIYDWVVLNAWREPKVKGCGEGDVQTMLETGNLGGKCADINALFVGLCRSVGIPARDVYGLRLAPSAFGYKELSAKPDKLQSAQHCRAEVYLKDKGWLAMDPADVAKVMRQETAEWLRSPEHAVVNPVYKGLFGGWEGNWMGFNTAHDVLLPQFSRKRISFLMYPVAEDDEGRLDSYAPDDFQYRITAKEVVV